MKLMKFKTEFSEFAHAMCGESETYIESTLITSSVFSSGCPHITKVANLNMMSDIGF